MNRGARGRLAAIVAVAACVAVAIAAIVWVASRTADDKTEALVEGGDMSIAEEIQGVSAAETDGESFLLDLSEHAAGEDERAVSWTESAGLTELAAEVIEAYRDEGSAVLLTSGYLDLKGNAWGGLVRSPRGWVDIVTVKSETDDSRSTARVVRLYAQDRDGGEE